MRELKPGSDGTWYTDAQRLSDRIFVDFSIVLATVFTVQAMNEFLDVQYMNALRGPPSGSVGMDDASPSRSREDNEIVLSLLTAVEDGATSQRRMAAQLGVALGLVNAYLKRCIKKGMVKVSEAPTRRYAYYLTPQGFAEKSRLTVEYLSSSFSFFRQAKSDCVEVFATAKARNFQNLVLCGRSDLAEVAVLSALESGVSVTAVIDRTAASSSFAGKQVFSNYDSVPTPFDAVLVTDMREARKRFEEAVELFGEDRVLAPKLLGLNGSQRRNSSQ
jgi:predicted transcriptional regulator